MCYGSCVIISRLVWEIRLIGGGGGGGGGGAFLGEMLLRSDGVMMDKVELGLTLLTLALVGVISLLTVSRRLAVD